MKSLISILALALAGAKINNSFLGGRTMAAYDCEDGDYIFGSGKYRYDSDGHRMRHMGGNRAMDMETGDIHHVHGWDDEDEDDD